jgi:hypothetical protein
MLYAVEITKVYFVQAESEGEAVQIALEMLERGESVIYLCLVVKVSR